MTLTNVLGSEDCIQYGPKLNYVTIFEDFGPWINFKINFFLIV